MSRQSFFTNANLIINAKPEQITGATSNALAIYDGNVSLSNDNNAATFSSTINNYTQTNGKITTYENYTIITWTSSSIGTFTPTSNLKIGCVVVGAGAGGPGTGSSYYNEISGGGGGVAFSPLSSPSSPTLTANISYSITVGTGGTGGARIDNNAYKHGTVGGVSKFTGTTPNIECTGGNVGVTSANANLNYTNDVLNAAGGNATGGVYNFNGITSIFKEMPVTADSRVLNNQCSAALLSIPEIGKYQLAYGGVGIAPIGSFGYGGIGGTWTPSFDGRPGQDGTVFIYFPTYNITNTMSSILETFKNTSIPETITISPNSSSAARTNKWQHNGINWIATASSIYGVINPERANTGLPSSFFQNVNPYNQSGLFDANSAGTNSYKAFDDNMSTYWASGSPLYSPSTGNYTSTKKTSVTSVTGASDILGEWLQLQSDTPIKMKTYNIATSESSAYSSPKNFSIVGSNDESTWYLIHSATNNAILLANQTANSYIGLFTVANLGNQNGYNTTTYSTSSDYYTYFRIIVTGIFFTASGRTKSYCSISEWLLNFYAESSTVSLSLDTNSINQMNVNGSLAITNGITPLYQFPDFNINQVGWVETVVPNMLNVTDDTYALNIQLPTGGKVFIKSNYGYPPGVYLIVLTLSLNSASDLKYLNVRIVQTTTSSHVGQDFSTLSGLYFMEPRPEVTYITNSYTHIWNHTSNDKYYIGGWAQHAGGSHADLYLDGTKLQITRLA